MRDDRSDLSSFTTVPWFCDPCKAGLETILCVSVMKVGLNTGGGDGGGAEYRGWG